MSGGREGRPRPAGLERLTIDPGGAAEVVAADWAAANGCAAVPVETVPGALGDLPVDRLSWTAPGRQPVVLCRIRGGGHGWPGGPQYLPSRLVGRVARRLDATGILLDFVRARIDGDHSSREV